MLGPLGGPELAIILVIVVILFGVGRISGVGRELGSSIKEFRRAVKDEEKEQEGQAPAEQQLNTTADESREREPQGTASGASSSEGSSQRSSSEGKPPSVF